MARTYQGDNLIKIPKILTVLAEEQAPALGISAKLIKLFSAKRHQQSQQSPSLQIGGRHWANQFYWQPVTIAHSLFSGARPGHCLTSGHWSRRSE